MIAAAALAGLLAFCVSATFDWVWQITVLPVAALLLGAVVLAPPSSSRAGGRAIPSRVALAIAGVAAIVLIALPLAGLASVRQSQTAADAQNVLSALDRAQTAHNVQPYAASPLLQRALLLEQVGDLAGAASAARGATRAEKQNWRTWLILSRVEAERGHSRKSVAAYRMARSLNPKSSLFR
jgi:hypothetical protein